MLDKFYGNDTELAHYYTMSCNHLSKTGFEILPPAYSLIGEHIDIYTENSFEIHLKSDYQFDIKLMSILKEKLCISNSRLDYLIKNNKIFCNMDRKIKKCKLQKEQIIYLTT